MQETRSTKGKPSFLVNNQVFEIEKEVRSSLYYRCIRKEKEGCPAREIIRREPRTIVERCSGVHTHEPDNNTFLKRKVHSAMKNAVLAEPKNGVKEVYSETLIATVHRTQNR